MSTPFLRAFTTHCKYQQPLMCNLIESIAEVPISWRKIMMSAVQIGRIEPWVEFSRSENRSFVRIETRIQGRVTTSWIQEHLEPLLYSTTFRSIIWMFLKVLPCRRDMLEEGVQIRKDGFIKEFTASQSTFSSTQIWDYSLLLGLTPSYPMPKDTVAVAKTIGYALASKLRSQGIWYPSVQRKKNVAYATAVEYCKYRPDRNYRSITTRDLEVLYAQEGVQIGGECEVRSAWKFNQLKPRVYYCQGGRDYFASRYIKQFAVLLMDCIPTTHRRRRTDPASFLQQNFEKDYIVTWDYSSFTTTLSELKFFLYAIIRFLEERAGIYDMRLFDYKDGIIRRSIIDMIDEYNKTCNIQGPFSIYRVTDWLFPDMDSTRTYHQQNNGMLGVAGNIGLSTAVHGYATLEVFDPDHGVCVGDDAFGITEDPDSGVAFMSTLCDINYDKFTIIPPLFEDPFKFLKRAFYRLPNGSFIMDNLLMFPIAPYIDGHTSHRDVPAPTGEDRIAKIVGQVGSLLWSMQNNYDLFQEDLDIIQSFLKVAYTFLGLPFRGSLPGQTLPRCKLVKQSKWLIPSIMLNEYDPRVIDWSEFLVRASFGQVIRLPIFQEKFQVVFPEDGAELYCTEERFWTCFEDLGFVEVEKVIIDHVVSEGTVRLVKKWLKVEKSSERQLIRVRVKHVPICFQELFTIPSHGPGWVASEL